MAKNVMKEIIIILLLCLAIILILGVLLYEFVPANKILPEQISYVAPQNIKEELQNIDGVDEDSVILTYELDQTDLNNYQRIKDYKPGKTNPFSSFEPQAQVQTQTQAGENTKTNSGSTGNANTNSNSNNTQTNNDSVTPASENSNGTTQSTGTNSNTTGYFQDKGTK